MKIRMDWPAPEHTRFASNAFDANVGKQITLNVDVLGVHCLARIDAAECTPEMAVFTFDIEDPEACAVISAAVATGGTQNLTIIDGDQA